MNAICCATSGCIQCGGRKGTIAVSLFRGKRHYDSAELENLSDRSLEDIGLEVRKQDFGTLKPFWIP